MHQRGDGEILHVSRLCHSISFALCAVLMALSMLGGCSNSGKTSVSPGAAAAKAMSLYDSNGDERIDAAELASCPPLALSLRSYDADGDGQLVLDEIVNRLQALFGSGSSLAEVSLSTTYEGRPLRGAKVSLRPVEFLADAITPAEGETDDNGVARPTIAADRLPDEFQGMRLIEHGLYHVEITHPQTQIPSRYNTATELGFEVDPLARGGTSAKFALKP